MLSSTSRLNAAHSSFKFPSASTTSSGISVPAIRRVINLLKILLVSSDTVGRGSSCSRRAIWGGAGGDVAATGSGTDGPLERVTLPVCTVVDIPTERRREWLNSTGEMDRDTPIVEELDDPELERYNKSSPAVYVEKHETLNTYA